MFICFGKNTRTDRRTVAPRTSCIIGKQDHCVAIKIRHRSYERQAAVSKSETPHIYYATPHIFTALHGMQSRYSDGNSVCLSNVCLSNVCQTRALWQNGRKLCLDFYIIWKNIYPSFLTRRIVGGGDPFYLKFWVNRPALERNSRFLTAPQPYDLAKKFN